MISLLAPGKIYINYLSILLFSIVAVALPQILDIFEESYPMNPRSEYDTHKKS